MADTAKSAATPDVELVGVTPATSDRQNGQSHPELTTSEKRKADSTTTDDTDGEGGKDLVETKQTTLDGVIQQEVKEDAGVQSQAKERKVGTEEENGRPSKKAKTTDTITDADAESSHNKGDAATPPKQKSQTDAPGDRPHKSVKKVDDLKDKPAVSTPTKSAQDGDVEMPATSSPSAATADDGAAPAGKPGATTSADDSTVPGDEEHLDHPENWTTGDEPATDKQKGFLKVLEKQKGVPMGDVDEIGKSEASEKIDAATGSARASAGNAGAPPSAKPTPAAPAPASAAAGGDDSTAPGEEAHLDHPENWSTGGDPATDKQKGFLKVLEKQKGVSVGDVSGIGKSEASEKIDELKNM